VISDFAKRLRRALFPIIVKDHFAILLWSATP
jgi:hypothetical protein